MSLVGPLRLGLRLAASDESSIAAATFIDLLIALRKELRDAKQYQLADRICTGLGELDIALEDGPSATTWKRLTSEPEASARR